MSDNKNLPLSKGAPYRTRTVPFLTRAQYELLNNASNVSHTIRAAAQTHWNAVQALNERVRAVTSSVVASAEDLTTLEKTFGKSSKYYQERKRSVVEHHFLQDSPEVQSITKAFRALDNEAERLVKIASDMQAAVRAAAPRPSGPADGPLRNDTNPPISRRQFGMLMRMRRGRIAEQARRHQEAVLLLKQQRDEAIKQICIRSPEIKLLDNKIHDINARYNSPMLAVKKGKKDMTPADREQITKLRERRHKVLEHYAAEDAAMIAAVQGLRQMDAEARTLRDRAVDVERREAEREAEREERERQKEAAEEKERQLREEHAQVPMEFSEGEEGEDIKEGDIWQGLPY